MCTSRASSVVFLFFFFFFFSSRRRHTRFKCDWSSDVCSSDLPFLFDVPVIAVDRHFLPPSREEEGKEIATLTMSVTTNEAALLSAAAREGKVSWLLRNPDDRGMPPKRERSRPGPF